MKTIVWDPNQNAMKEKFPLKAVALLREIPLYFITIFTTHIP